MAYIINLALFGATFAALLWGSLGLLFLFACVAILAAVLSAFAIHKGANRIVWIWPVVAIAVGFVGANLAAARVEDPLWGHFIHDAGLGWKPKANLRDELLPAAGGAEYRVSTDPNGYRNPPSATKDYDFILQGDSNGFGFGVTNDEHLCALIPHCYNASVPGYDLNQFLLQARAGLPVRAKTRILLFNLENDFTLSMFATPYLVRRPYFEVDGGQLRMVSRTMPLLKQIYGFRFIDRYSAYDGQLSQFEQGQSWGNRVPDWISRFPALQRMALRNEKVFQSLSNIGSVAPPDLNQWPDQPDWSLTKKESWPEPYLSYAADFELIFDQYLQEAGDTIVILRPMKKQVVRSEREAALSRLASKPIDILALNRLVNDIARRRGARVVDPTDAMQSHPDPDLLFLSGDTHLSPAGHALIAAEFGKSLRQP